MDNLSHTLLGIALSKAGLEQRYGRGTTLALVVASNLPDLDAALMFLGGDAWLYRRTLTHSVFGLPVLAAAAGAVFHRFYPQISWKSFFGLILLGLGCHVFLDLLNSYGVVLLYPLSRQRFELSWVFIIDLVFWALLALPIVVSLLSAKPAPRVWRGALLGLGLYIGFCATGRAVAGHVFHKSIVNEGMKPDFTYIFPEALGPHRFRGVVKEKGEFRLGLIHWLGGRLEWAGRFQSEDDDLLVRSARDSDFGRKLDWFFKAPVWRRAPDAPDQAEVFDLRFQSIVLRWRKSPFYFRVIPEIYEKG